MKEELRDEIKKQVGIVPISVQSGSVQNVIRWKDKVINAMRIANNPKSTEYELKITLSELKRST